MMMMIAVLMMMAMMMMIMNIQHSPHRHSPHQTFTAHFVRNLRLPHQIFYTTFVKKKTEPSPDIYDTRLSPHRTSRRGVIDVTFDILSKTCFNLSISLTHSPMLLTDYYLFTRK